MSKIDLAQEKLLRKVRNAKDRWVAAIKDSRSFEEYVNKIASFTGLSPAVVRASAPARNWADFQANAERYVDIWINNLISAIERGKWKNNYIRAFGGK